LLLWALNTQAQNTALPGNPVNLQNAPQRDTTNRKSQANWRDEPVKIFATKAFSNIRFSPDTNLHNFQRRPFLQDWYRDLGNHGSPARNQYFSPENLGNTGPSLGYHAFDVYRFKADSLLYYNTTRPFTAFDYQLGSKLEQTLHLLHTQNISSRWNFAVQYQKIGSEGFFKIQRTNHDAGALSTHYTGPRQQYTLYAAVVYNKEQNDENGGILGDSLLHTSKYSDLQTIPVALDNPFYQGSNSNGRRSAITNVMRDYNILIRHQYTWGHRDTVYNRDSTQYGINLVPRFSIMHRLEAGSAKHTFKDVMPDSTVYSPFFNRSFATLDSVYSQQNWAWFDNRISLNGFIGQKEKQLAVSAGIGNRLDNFYTYYISDKNSSQTLSTYIDGELQKEAIGNRSWGYQAKAKFIIAGSAVGDFLLMGSASKDFGRNIGTLSIGGQQQLSDAPYAYTLYQNQYFQESKSLNKESITLLWASVYNERFGVRVSFKNYVIDNFIYLGDTLNAVTNGRLEFNQDAQAFNLSQLSIQKIFKWGPVVLDNEFTLQQVTGNAPLSVPLILGRNALSYENYLFRHALKMATGIEVRYFSAYKAEGYSPFYNRFYFQNTYTDNNQPEANVFFNFKVKRFRAFLMGDQLQTLLWRNTIVHPNYPSPNVMIRFGFDWVLVN